MPKPLTMYKDGQAVSNIYPSERTAWEGQGWSLSPVAKAPNPPTEVQDPKVVFSQSELEDMHWTAIKDIAEELGLAKADDQAWKDLIPAILEAQNA